MNPTPPQNETRLRFESRIPFVTERIHAAAIYCSDGRWGLQMDEFLQDALRLPRYDRVAIPGGAGCLAGHVPSWKEESALLEQFGLLVEVHGLRRVVLIAHQDCAFYAVRLRLEGADRERQQRLDLDSAAQRLARSHGLGVESWFARRDGSLVRFERWDATA
jgi:carbonic anhydrase-like protein